MSYVLIPLLSERDEAESAEGGIDPLGLYTIADALGVRLVPGVRERQTHPRFLTATAVSLAVCGAFDEETLAADHSTEPWLVFEWYLVEGLVRSSESKEETRGLPGSQKAAKAKDDKVPLSAKRYLKSPAIFGFHGIYRLLGRTLGVETKSGSRLGEAGAELLSVWSKEQGLDGFIGTTGGVGQLLRRHWQDAVRDGLQNASTAKSPRSGWNAFREHLGIYNSGPNEKQYIATMLRSGEIGFRREVLDFLVSPSGRVVWEETESERHFHEALRGIASDDMRLLLDAIAAYETFARLCQDAFDECLREMTRQHGKTPASQLGQLDLVVRASQRVPKIFAEVVQRLEPFGEAARFRDTFSSLAEPSDPASWAVRLAEHHCSTQNRKPPDGKNPWFDRFDDGSYMIRSLYCRDEGGRDDDSYVHAYRTRSLWSFAKDLGMLEP
jgi:hypothetical protein